MAQRIASSGLKPCITKGPIGITDSVSMTGFSAWFCSVATTAPKQGMAAGEGAAVSRMSRGEIPQQDGKTARRKTGIVPSVLVQFGTRGNTLSFVSNPGVMAVAKLLEMRSLVKPRAEFTQENIDAIREFDEELARKCQVAYDNGLHMNMMDVEHIDRPGYVDALLHDKAKVAAARKEVMALPLGGPYLQPKALDDYQPAEVQPSWNPQYEVGPEVFQVQPGYRQEVELRGIVKTFLESEQGKGAPAQSSDVKRNAAAPDKGQTKLS